MANTTLSPVGLLMAGTMSVSNVMTDVARKRALAKRELVAATLWIRVVVAAIFAIALAVRWMMGTAPVIRDGGALFGIEALHVPPLVTFAVYLVVDVLMVGCCIWLYFRALQISPISVCVPFMAFTPVFLIPTGFVLLGELPAPIKLLGVVLIVVGSLVMHRRLFAIGWLAPVKAIIEEKGSRYMLMVAFLFSLTNPIEKKMVLMSDPFTEAFAYGTGLCIWFLVLGLVQKADFKSAIRQNVGWMLLAGALDALTLLLQLASYNFIDVVITVSIKRAGIILSVFSGWLFFHEQGITDKVIAASVMFCGVLILYLPLNTIQALGLAALTLVGMAVALYVTRNEAPVES